MLSLEKCRELLGISEAELDDAAVLQLRDEILSMTDRAVEAALKRHQASEAEEGAVKGVADPKD